MKKFIFMVLGLGFIMVMVTSCATFRNNQLTDVGQISLPPGVPRITEVTYNFRSGTEMSGTKRFHPENIRQKLENTLETTLRESRYFYSVHKGDGGVLHIDAELLNYGNALAASAAGFVGGLTLMTVPCWATDNYRLYVKVTTPEGDKRQYDYVLNDSITTVIWAPLILVTPVFWPPTVSEQLQGNMYKTILVKMKDDGLLTPPSTAASPSGS